MGYSAAELQRFAGRSVPDLLPDPLRLLVVGINPSLWTAATGAHFARPGNRYYPALARAGIISHPFDASDGYRPEDLAELHRLGIGNTNLVSRATARADELSREELRSGARRLERLVARRRPAVVAVLGVTAYRQAFGVPRATLGKQPQPLAGARLFVLPNPSGLNAHETIDSLAAQYAHAARAAGILG
ncbi:MULTISPECIES: mismatch-specific DNA-glycosylase [unclassified Luteococcus]|uniref:mismatch-specific DNA-glycosylase n=1 Tax=unclassified Luteococcus TaxID=2639923 RepID=UPI00313EE2BE